MRQPPIMQQRKKVVPRARGKVLEIGIGSGLNLNFYDRDQVSELHGLDPSAELGVLAQSRAREAGVDVNLIQLSSEEIPVETDAYDSIVVTYTLCTIPDVERALGEMRRVLKPEGDLYFAEHGLSPDANVAAWQRRLNGIWSKIAGGCNLIRDVDVMLSSTGFDVVEMDRMYLPGPKPISYNYWGVARIRA